MWKRQPGRSPGSLRDKQECAGIPRLSALASALSRRREREQYVR